MNVVTRGIRNAFRNAIRTASIVLILGLTIGLSLSMLIARQAVSDKITSVKASVGNTVTISPAGLRGFEGGGDALTETDVASVEDIDHVTAVDKALTDRLDSDTTDLESSIEAGSLGKRFSQNNGQTFSVERPAGLANGEDGGDNVTTSFTPPVTVIGTTDPTDLSITSGGGTFTLQSGETFASDSSENVAVLGTKIAEKNELKVGNTFTAYGQTITVVGIFDAGNDFSNNQVIMPLATVQTLTGQTGSITNVIVTVDSIENVENVASAISGKLGDSADVTNSAAEAAEAIEPLENIRTISTYSLLGAVGAGAVIILLTMIMIVRERRREIGVIKAIGASNIRIISQFMVEAVTLTSLGAIIGIIGGFIAGNPITKLLINNSSSSTPDDGPGGGGMMVRLTGGIGNSVTNVTASVGWDIILYGFGAAILIGVVGSAIASYFIAKVRPAEVMRAD